ncbi:O-antigen export system permease protein RfbA [Micromonospora saelicesensis]|uniref:Transport permease protein n=1 Tax=Micromonospora saelicesensis TaxID=285676 RepID=A0A328NDE5_9ACTN|nr:ABC transporter permease [Micromonospora saelicesensis]RAO27184.1 O-antigen export system permease protein RfbA [Micromonospora saelicesensis]
MATTALVDPDTGLTQAQLAARHGLRVAGERPSLVEYSRRLWAYRHFIAAYANAKLVASYSNAKLGQLWQVLTPLTNAAVYYLIFGVVLAQNDNIPNFIAYLTTGLFIFNFTQSAVLAGTQSISSNLGLIRALHFPRASLPLSTTITQFQQLLASMVVLVGIVLVTGEPLTWKWLMLLPALLLQAVFNAGVVLLVARLGSKASDLKQVMPFVMRTWMYGSGVLYSVSLFDRLPGWATTLVQYNPLLVYIELARYALLEEAPLLNESLTQLWLVGAGWALVAGIGGFIYFWRGEQEYGRG